MSNKTKYYVIGTLAAAIGGFFIQGVSDTGVAYTGSKEGFRSIPYKDVGGVPTVAFGNTVHPDGRKVKMTDPPVSKKQGLEYLKAHYAKDAPVFNKSLQGIKLSQDEYDLYADFSYQFGQSTWAKSSMLKNLKTGQYVQACKSLLKYKYAAGHDCSVRSNNCYGVYLRQVERYDKCMGANL
jgi:GH24 family phage-related lysozyme (muramidase)